MNSEFNRALVRDAMRAIHTQGMPIKRAALIYHQDANDLAELSWPLDVGIAPGYQGWKPGRRKARRAAAQSAPPAVCSETAHRSIVVSSQHSITVHTLIKRAKSAAWPDYQRRRPTSKDRTRTGCGTSGWIYWIQGGE